MPLLEAQGISKVFGKLTALDGAALTVGENEFHGLIGPNGSGKSTLMKCVAGARCRPRARSPSSTPTSRHSRRPSALAPA